MRAVMSFARALLVLLVLAVPRPAIAAEYADSAALDELFAQLRAAHSAPEADEISQQIWAYWLNPSDSVLANHMSRASDALHIGDLSTSLEVLTLVVTQYPDYSEGWNQRATLYYMLDDFEASLADIDKVLALEPRHYGALSGRVLIELKQGKRAEALRDMVAALAIHPYLGEKRFFPELQQDVTHV